MRVNNDMHMHAYSRPHTVDTVSYIVQWTEIEMEWMKCTCTEHRMNIVQQPEKGRRKQSGWIVNICFLWVFPILYAFLGMNRMQNARRSRRMTYGRAVWLCSVAFLQCRSPSTIVKQQWVWIFKVIIWLNWQPWPNEETAFTHSYAF